MKLDKDFIPEYTGDSLEIEYVPGKSPDFVVYIQALGDKAELSSVEGHARWVVTREDGTKFIARPEDTKPSSLIHKSHSSNKPI